ncbi:MAG: hypothetical protein UV59_C0006G0043 [Candidatus Gottesmanbacteria bacterium GW2011_GWA1_43_11]|uniref:Uncharacterized protein n=1 Tax=Candidatus Gottesmanbacteria bacterium GW2011_GWA1_43_11 TaxID=1618436 RepID=A0A0G1CJD3_9BACT|nr:MAG: hypothetical protein UV59_C0006G0043 [Candidatus Gottesmanbacteria bacterium GW2011_GWA1_43_11]
MVRTSDSGQARMTSFWGRLRAKCGGGLQNLTTALTSFKWENYLMRVAPAGIQWLI